MLAAGNIQGQNDRVVKFSVSQIFRQGAREVCVLDRVNVLAVILDLCIPSATISELDYNVRMEAKDIGNVRQSLVHGAVLQHQVIQ
jgi:hypothetical protein